MRGAFSENFRQFISDSFRRDLRNVMREFPDGHERGGMNRISEARGKAHGTNHAQFVLTETLFRLPDRANDSRGKIIPPAKEVEHFVRLRIEQQRVNREVPATDVFLWRLGVNNVVRM